MSYMLQIIISWEVIFYVHGHFTSSSGGRGGLRNPFSQNFVPTLPCSPKFSSYAQSTKDENLRSNVLPCRRGTSGENLRSKVLHLFGMEIYLRYFEEGIQKIQRTSRRVRFYFIPFEVIRNPHVSAVRCKRASAVWFVCIRSVMSIYMHMYIYVYYRELFLPWR